MKPTCPKCRSDDIIMSYDQSYGRCRYCDTTFKISIPRRVLNEREISLLSKKKDEVLESCKSIENTISKYEKTTSLPSAGTVIGYMLSVSFFWFILGGILTICKAEKLLTILTIIAIIYEAGSVCYLIYWLFAYPIARYNINKYQEYKKRLSTEINELTVKISNLSRTPSDY